MALKTVVEDAFFDEIMPLVRDFQISRGELALAILTSTIGQTPTWDLTLAGPELDAKPIQRVGADAAEFFRNRLTENSVQQLRYIRIRPMADPLVQAFVRSLDVPRIEKAYAVSSSGMEDYRLDEIVVLLAHDVENEHLLHKLSA